MLDDRMIANLRASLEEQRRHLRREIEDQGADADSDEFAFGDDAGFSDRSHSTEERSRSISLVKALRSNLLEVDRALVKRNAGTYGTCERCGEPIAVERLEAIPWATQCMACKQKGIIG